MQGFPKPYQVEARRRNYPVGSTVEVISMNDPFSPIPPGTRGKVQFVDSTGTVFADWENGSSLGAVYGEDSIKRID
jgi:hypothetical protein